MAFSLNMVKNCMLLCCSCSFVVFQARSQNCEKQLLASSCLSVCLSVRLHGTTCLPLDGFSRNLIFEYFRKSAEKIQVSLTSDKNNGYFT
jgi:hypothetical protein